MRKSTLTRAILLLALVASVWLTQAPAAHAYTYCGPMPNCPGSTCCQNLWNYCMCDCMNQTSTPWGGGDYGLCYSACSAEMRIYCQ